MTKRYLEDFANLRLRTGTITGAFGISVIEIQRLSQCDQALRGQCTEHPAGEPGGAAPSTQAEARASRLGVQ
jgi:hypothetical protein